MMLSLMFPLLTFAFDFLGVGKLQAVKVGGEQIPRGSFNSLARVAARSAAQRSVLAGAPIALTH